MEALSRKEYPEVLGKLQPSSAASKLNDRVKKIGKTNTEIADWLQERRKVEEQYVAGLHKLARRPLQEVGGDLGVFDSPWRKLVASVEELAKSHAQFSNRVEQDVEEPLRNFHKNVRESIGITTTQGNLNAMAKDLEEAQHRSDKVASKGGKASSQKMDNVSSRLDTANSQWKSQSPFIFESLQALDEKRLNHLRDVLTQYGTHETDQLQRSQKAIEEVLGSLLEVDTAQEIKNWSSAASGGRPMTMTERASMARQLSNAGSSIPSIRPTSRDTDTRSEVSQPPPPIPKETGELKELKESKESKLKSRFGTILGRRRQSVHNTFGRAPSPSKGYTAFGRNTSSRDGPPVPSPRASVNNLRDNGRLASLAESPPETSPTNGVNSGSSFIADAIPERGSSNTPNGVATTGLVDLSDVQPPPGPPPSHLKAVPESQTDSEGYTVPPAMNDPISQAEHDAEHDVDHSQFKVDIRNEPIPEQDADAQAALSNVANTLRSAAIPAPNRKAGTVRGRRDVRNTVYQPSSSNLGVERQDIGIPPSPGIATGRAAALVALSSDVTEGGSDTTSIRSGHSLSNNVVVKHADMTHLNGLNASVIETVDASFENGIVKYASVKGEVALFYHGEPESSSLLDHATIRINNFLNLEAIGPNHTFLQQISDDKTDEFSVDLSKITAKSQAAFTYRAHLDSASLEKQGPLMITVAWKQINENNLGAIIEYSLNPECGTSSATLTNLMIVAKYEGGRSSAAQMKPFGIHLKEKHLAYWKLGDVTLDSSSHRLVARFTGVEGQELPQAGHVEARWEIINSADLPLGSGISLSKLEPSKGKEKEAEDDPFADESVATPTTATPVGNWLEINTLKKLVSGKYEARHVQVPASP